MWHCSIGLGGRAITGYERQLAQIARSVAGLHGVGDATLGEWEEVGGVAVHVRRRLSEAEAVPLGPMRDIRNTEEALRRYRAIERYIEPGMRAWTRQELTTPQEPAP